MVHDGTAFTAFFGQTLMLTSEKHLMGITVSGDRGSPGQKLVPSIYLSHIKFLQRAFVQPPYRTGPFCFRLGQ